MYLTNSYLQICSPEVFSVNWFWFSISTYKITLKKVVIESKEVHLYCFYLSRFIMLVPILFWVSDILALLQLRITWSYCGWLWASNKVFLFPYCFILHLSLFSSQKHSFDLIRVGSFPLSSLYTAGVRVNGHHCLYLRFTKNFYRSEDTVNMSNNVLTCDNSNKSCLSNV